MIESIKVKDRKSLVEFIITSISDGDFRAKIQDVPDVLDDHDTFDVNKFLSELKEIPGDKCPNAEIQNSAMLFVELMLKGNLAVSKEQLNELSSLMK